MTEKWSRCTKVSSMGVKANFFAFYEPVVGRNQDGRLVVFGVWSDGKV